MSSWQDNEFKAFQGTCYRMAGDGNLLPATPADSRKRSSGLADLDAKPGAVGQAGSSVIVVDEAGSAGEGGGNAAMKEQLQKMNTVMASWRIPPERYYLKALDDLESLQLTVTLALSDDLKGWTRDNMKDVLGGYLAL